MHKSIFQLAKKAYQTHCKANGFKFARDFDLLIGKEQASWIAVVQCVRDELESVG